MTSFVNIVILYSSIFHISAEFFSYFYTHCIASVTLDRMWCSETRVHRRKVFLRGKRPREKNEDKQTLK